jgi:hypothetical protein
MKTKIGLIALMVILPFYLFADPAKKVTLSYNKETKKLSMVIDHPVANVNDHYISEIKILVDGKEVKVIKPKKQSSMKAETQEVEVSEIKPGSKVEVKTTCNQFGSKSGKLTVDK